MKKIFALTGPFVPTNEPMTLLPYKQLRTLDAKIDVVALTHDEDESLKEKLCNDENYKKFNVKYVGKYNDALFSIKNVNLFKALYNFNKYISNSVKMFDKQKYDVLYTSSFPIFTHIAGLKIKKNNKVLWVANFTDPINHSPYKVDDKDTYKNYSLIEKIAFKVYCHYYVVDEVEKDTFENADILTFICEEQRDFMFDQYEKYYHNISRELLMKKSLILPLCYVDEFEDIKPIKREYNQGQEIVLSHFGRVYGLRDASIFIKAFKELVDENAFNKKVIIEQFGEFKKKDLKLIKQLNLNEYFRISKKIPYEKCIEKMNDSDGLLIFDTIMPEESWQPYLPSKILEYSLLKKKVFAITTTKSPTYRIMTQSNAICAKNDINDIKDKLIKFINLDDSIIKYDYESKEIGKLLDDKINDLLG